VIGVVVCKAKGLWLGSMFLRLRLHCLLVVVHLTVAGTHGKIVSTSCTPSLSAAWYVHVSYTVTAAHKGLNRLWPPTSLKPFSQEEESGI